MTRFELRTERLILRPHRVEDIPFMIKLNSDPEVTRYTGNGPLTEAEAAAIVARCDTAFASRRIGRFVATESARECLRYGFEDLGIDSVTARADMQNTGSLHVLKKLGFSETSQGHDEIEPFFDFTLERGDFPRSP